MNGFNSIQSLTSRLLSKIETVFIDLGSSNTRICLGKKEVFNEPTCIAVHTGSQSVVAVGEKALRLLGKTPNSVEVVFPILFGEVAHTTYLEYFLAAVIEHSVSRHKLKRHLFGLSAKVAVSSSLSPAKMTLLKQILKSVGFTKIELVSGGFVIAKRIAANDFKLKDICVLDLGAQKAEISIFSLGELLCSKSYHWGGVLLTETLQTVVRDKQHCVVSWHVAEAAKKEIGSFTTSKEKMAIRGKDLVTQAAKTVIINAVDLRTEYSTLLEELLDEIQQFISLLPSEVAVSVLDRGIYITGGTSQLAGLDTAVIEKFKCDVLISTNPEKDIITGLQVI